MKIISVIIPVLNEAGKIKEALVSLQNAADVEVIVVDGGSQDETVAVASSLGVQVLSSPVGRARQMNAGAKGACGNILLFLHADTCLPVGFDTLVREALTKPRTVAGAFELRIDAKLLGLRLVERIANWRSRSFSLPYGDQAIFIRADIFHDMGGFPDLPIMEDFEFVLRLRRWGRIEIVLVPVLTSGRRWQRLGVLTTTLINQLIVVGYFLGVPPERLVRWYRR
ncbi:MAG: TIGR04283 family arsenosugar biosynthesis glycosyltransferase [Chamaesiphon sp.]